MKTMIVQKLGEKSITNYIPASHAEALTFASSVMDGELTAYSTSAPVGNDEATSSFSVTVMIQQDSNNEKTYLNFVLKSTKDELDLFPALQGKTFNGIKADKIVIISFRSNTH